MTLFIVVALMATLLSVALVVVPLYRTPESRAALSAVFTALLFPLVVVALYAYITSYPWLTAADTGSLLPVRSDTAEINALRGQLAGTAADAGIWSRLGELYIAQERFADAREAYRKALELNEGGSDEERLAFAEAAVLADRDSLSGEAAKVIDEVLQRSPGNPKALWYGAMSALSQGNTELARSRWKTLLGLDPPPQVREIIEQQLANLDGAADAAMKSEGAAVGDALRIPVRVNVIPDLAKRIEPGALLFLIAREPGKSGPPIAVVRKNAAGWPLNLEITDADSMVPGRSLSGLGEIILTARVANDGEAMAAKGDVFGETTWRAASRSSEPLQILMDKVVE
jgi:cytochrome c-type biogenesis protein CcmH